MTISTTGWILVGVAAWLVVAAVVGMLIGWVIRRRDQQVPRAPVDDTRGGIPDPDGVPRAPDGSRR